MILSGDGLLSELSHSTGFNVDFIMAAWKEVENSAPGLKQEGGQCVCASALAGDPAVKAAKGNREHVCGIRQNVY